MRPLAAWGATAMLATNVADFASARTQAGSAPVLGYQIQRVYPHDPAAFTQGLEYADGFLYEGTGLNGGSSIRKVRLETGEVVQKRDILDRAGRSPRGRRPRSYDAVLNGIAYDEPRDRLFVTGKLWPKLFEIKITPGR